MNPAILLLTDSRLPAGGHAHSGGTEQAIATGAVHDVASLTRFLEGRLHTTGLVAAALAAAACNLAAWDPSLPSAAEAGSSSGQPSTRGSSGQPTTRSEGWEELDAEVDARTPSPAQRKASRTQGRLLLRVARRLWPAEVLEELAAAVPHPHHPVALGAVAHAAGATPQDAALAAAYHAITGPATAAVRLLGLDPVAVHRVLATLTPTLTTIATTALPPPTTPSHTTPSHTTPSHAASSHATDGRVGRWAGLAAHSAPALDLLAERHVRADVRLFVS